MSGTVILLGICFAIACQAADNALAETINGLYKAEVILQSGPWKSFYAVEYTTLKWVDWVNNHRILGPFGNMPPAEAEAKHYANLDKRPMAA